MPDSTYGSNYTQVAATTATDTVIKASAGRLCSVQVIVTGSNPMAIYDNATAGSGTVLAQLPASPTVGTIYQFLIPSVNGITVKGSATNPGVNIVWY